MEIELRTYRVKEGALGQFVEAWRTQVVPFRGELGFRVLGAWHSPDEREFVWQVTHDTATSLEDAERSYAAARAERVFDPDPAQFLDLVDVRFLETIEA